MAHLTPNTPTGYVDLLVHVPNTLVPSVVGVLSYLGDPLHWLKFGDLTIAETVELVGIMLYELVESTQVESDVALGLHYSLVSPPSPPPVDSGYLLSNGERGGLSVGGGGYVTYTSSVTTILYSFVFPSPTKLTKAVLSGLVDRVSDTIYEPHNFKVLYSDNGSSYTAGPETTYTSYPSGNYLYDQELDLSSIANPHAYWRVQIDTSPVGRKFAFSEIELFAMVPV